MRTTLLAACAALVLTPPTVSGQDNPMVASLRSLHDVTQRNIMRTAEMLDEEMYAFRPTDEVRTTGEMLAHIANAQYAFCSSAAGEQSPATENFEETRTTRVAIMEALEMAFGYCAQVYDRITDADLARQRNLFGTPQAASGILAFNSAHNYEHYGNLVTYMRINGITPPSSM